ncbi:hypothetical protein A5737_21485 [Mycobacterium colombiense]|nr:hypothetical protein A5737_21485 [Mycobacterium colombiense]
MEFGSTEESQLLEQFFTLPRPPDPERPFRAPWKKEGKDSWQKRKYPGGVLQRLRGDQSGKGRVILQTKGVDRQRDTWKLTPQAGAELMSGNYPQIRIVDLALWFGREVDVDTLNPAITAELPATADDLDRLVAWFFIEFHPNVADLVGTVYSLEIPAEYRQVPFQENPIGVDTLEQLGSLPPAPTVSLDLASLTTALEKRLTDKGFQLPPGIVRRVLAAWLRGDIVVLLGQPGTGKTLFASLLARALEAELDLDAPTMIAVRADFDETEFIGYERLDGTPELRQFAQDVLTTDRPLEAKVVILEEFNLAAIETYLASVLVATQEPGRRVPLPGGQLGQLPVDTFIIATCNSYRDEPETRTRVSSPTKRRSTIITMPNVLADRFDANPETAILDFVKSLVDNEIQRVAERRAASRPSQFDGLRDAGLGQFRSVQDISERAQNVVTDLCTAILETAPGRSWFTLGLLRDVVLTLVYADRDEQAELAALGQAVADKLIHQFRGSHADMEAVREVCAQLPNAIELDGLIQRMMDGPSDELLPLV